MAERTSIRVIRSVAEVEEVRSLWTSWQWHPNSDIDFYLTILHSRPEILRPHVIVLYRGGCPDAMLIGRMEQTQIHFKVGYRRLFKIRARLLTFILGGILGNPSPQNCEVLVQEMMNCLRKEGADLALLSHVRVDSPIYRSATRWPGLLARDHFPAWGVHRSMTLPDSVEEFYQRLSGKVRKNQKWQAKKFIQDYAGKLRINCFREVSELECMIHDVEEVARKTYQRGLGVGFVDSLEMRQRLDLEARKGWLRAFVLYAADKPCAFWIGTAYSETFYSDFMGYDPNYGKYSPGMFLIVRVIEDLCNHQGKDHMKEIDFGLGDAPYKALLGNCEWWEASVYIFAPTLKAFGLNALRTPAILLERLAKKGLEKAKLLPRIKRIWRDRVRRD